MNFKSGCFLLSVCHVGSAIALGLGDVSVRSHLGQPLHAVVPLLGATPDIRADCLGLANSPDGIAPLPPTRLSLEQAGDQSLLHIRTDQSVSDPVLQFVLTADCDTRLQREYAVLLDPPAQVETTVGLDVAHADTQTVAESGMAVAPPPAPARRRLAAVKRVAAAPAAVPAIPARTATPVPRPPAPASTPRLVLSGKRSDTGGVPHAALSEPAKASVDVMNAAVLSDDGTALKHRIAHLEARLAALQQRNAELDRALAREAVPVAVMPPPVKQAPQWPWYLLGMSLLAGAAALMAAALRRRGPKPEPLAKFTSSAWVQPDTLPAYRTDDPDGLSDATVLQRMPEIVAPQRDDGTELKEDVLDQAEVFMAHGHGELAIHLLQEHLRDSPGDSPVPWLLLLDLLHRAGDTASYAEASAECRRRFNVNLDGRSFFNDGEGGQGLEAYPHLLEQLVKVWNTPDINGFFDDLIYDQRGGTRIGFEPAAYRDILLLRSLVSDTQQAGLPEMHFERNAA